VEGVAELLGFFDPAFFFELDAVVDAEGLGEQAGDDFDESGVGGEALVTLTGEVDGDGADGVVAVADGEADEAQVVGVFLGGLEDLRHVGACHLYIHATESTERPWMAEPCAEFIGSSIPGASHINHMPSHTWNEIGEWGKAVRANLQAWHSDQKAKVGKGVAIYPSHNLHMLLYAASFDGQGAIAIQAARDYGRSTGSTMFEVLTLIRFGRFEEVLAVKDRPEGIIPGGCWDFARGYAHLRKGESDFARLYLNRVKTAADTSSSKFRGHSSLHLLGTLGGILEGEVFRSVGEIESAVASFEKAVLFEDAMDYDEPEPLPFSARHWLGAALLEAEQYEKAEKVYREALKDHPNNGWCLFGLLEALKAQGKPAAEIQKEFEKRWSRADHWIEASRF